MSKIKELMEEAKKFHKIQQEQMHKRRLKADLNAIKSAADLGFQATYEDSLYEVSEKAKMFLIENAERTTIMLPLLSDGRDQYFSYVDSTGITHWEIGEILSKRPDKSVGDPPVVYATIIDGNGDVIDLATDE